MMWFWSDGVGGVAVGIVHAGTYSDTRIAVLTTSVGRAVSI